MNKDEMRKILREMYNEFCGSPYEFLEFLEEEGKGILEEDLEILADKQQINLWKLLRNGLQKILDTQIPDNLDELEMEKAFQKVRERIK